MHNDPLYSTILADEPEFAPVVSRFVAGLPAMLNEISQAWQQHDWTRLRGAAHNLKGAAGNLGFPLLMQTAGRIEANALHQNSEGMEQLLAELQQLAARIAFDP